MPDVKLSVSADVGGLNAGLAAIGHNVDGLGQSLQGLKIPTPDTSGVERTAAKLRDAVGIGKPGGMKWSPFDMRATERDIAKLRQQLIDLQKLSGTAGSPFGIPPAVPVSHKRPGMVQRIGPRSALVSAHPKPSIPGPVPGHVRACVRDRRHGGAVPAVDGRGDPAVFAGAA